MKCLRSLIFVIIFISTTHSCYFPMTPHLSFANSNDSLYCLSPVHLQYCLSPIGLEVYRQHLDKYLPSLVKADNKLRDVSDEYFTGGHAFRVTKDSRELIFSFDVCGGCEAHAVLAAMRRDSSVTVDSAPTLRESGSKWVDKNSRVFRYCPHPS